MAKKTLNNHNGSRVNCIDNSRPKQTDSDDNGQVGIIEY